MKADTDEQPGTRRILEDPALIQSKQRSFIELKNTITKGQIQARGMIQKATVQRCSFDK